MPSLGQWQEPYCFSTSSEKQDSHLAAILKKVRPHFFGVSSRFGQFPIKKNFLFALYMKIFWTATPIEPIWQSSIHARDHSSNPEIYIGVELFLSWIWAITRSSAGSWAAALSSANEVWLIDCTVHRELNVSSYKHTATGKEFCFIQCGDCSVFTCFWRLHVSRRQ